MERIIYYKAKFTEVKQARWVKPEDTRSSIYVTPLSMSILWSAARVYRKKELEFQGFLNS